MHSCLTLCAVTGRKSLAPDDDNPVIELEMKCIAEADKQELSSD